MESTKLLCKAVPLSLLKAHVPDGAKLNKVLLFETEANFIKNGGGYFSVCGGTCLITDLDYKPKSFLEYEIELLLKQGNYLLQSCVNTQSQTL